MNKYNLEFFNNCESYKVSKFDAGNIDNSFVKVFREKHSLTQVKLANILGVSKKTIEKWEQGKNKLTGTAATLLYLLDIEPKMMERLFLIEKTE